MRSSHSHAGLTGIGRTLARAAYRGRTLTAAGLGGALLLVLLLLGIDQALHARQGDVSAMATRAWTVEAELLRTNERLVRVVRSASTLRASDWRSAYARSKGRMRDLLARAPGHDDATVAARLDEMRAAAEATLERARHATILLSYGRRDLAARSLDTTDARAKRAALARKSADYARAVRAYAERERERLDARRFELLVGVGATGALLLACLIAFCLRGIERGLRGSLRELSSMATRCDLTGLPNRRAFDALLHAHVLDTAPFALLIIDLDGFKPINDAHGHAAGDAALREVAARLTAFVGATRDSSPVARLGGDEFGVLVPLDAKLSPEVRHRRALAVASDLRTALAAPLRLEATCLRLSASIGVACHPEHGGEAAETTPVPDPAEALHHAAGMALQHAKARRGAIRPYEPAMDVDRRAEDALRAEVTLARAAREFEPFLQPVVELASGRTVSFEMLARWRRGDRVVGPGAFLDAVAGAGLLDALTLDLVDRVLPAMRDWARPVPVSINLTSAQVEDEEFVSRLCRRIERSGVPGDRLEVELLEDGVFSDAPAAALGIGALRAAGMSVALDDFGMGYSNFARLRDTQIDKLKIDRAFVMGMGRSATDRSVVRAALDISAAMGAEPVAEGVEDASMVETLRGMGCRYGQGFHFARPMSLEDASEHLRDELRATGGRNARARTSGTSRALAIA